MDEHWCRMHPKDAFERYVEQFWIFIHQAFDEIRREIELLGMANTAQMPYFDKIVRGRLLVISLNTPTDEIYFLFYFKIMEAYSSHYASLRAIGVPSRFLANLLMTRSSVASAIATLGVGSPSIKISAEEGDPLPATHWEFRNNALVEVIRIELMIFFSKISKIFKYQLISN